MTNDHTPSERHPLSDVAAAAQNPKLSPQARTFARQRALQALYQWSLTGQDIQTIEQQFMAEQPMDRVDVAYFQQLLHGIPTCIETLDNHINPLLDRSINQLDPVEHTILWIGCYELSYHKEVPWRVVINEGVELAKKFGATESYKYINGVLDKLSKQLV